MIITLFDGSVSDGACQLEIAIDEDRTLYAFCSLDEAGWSVDGASEGWGDLTPEDAALWAEVGAESAIRDWLPTA